MRELYLFSVWLHIIAAATWLGGMIFLVAVLVPMLRAPATRERAMELFHLLGVRFRRVGWLALVTLIVTGTFNIVSRGFRVEQIVSGAVFAGEWGHRLLVKLVLVTIALTLGVIHDFWVGPRATELAADPSADAKTRERARRRASFMGRASFFLALAIVAAAVTLVR